ncbi:MAG: glycosyltransferase family 4 protein, partial [Gemmatimonadaceae bacterium]|nr:glycosyltransferase family 4 protein [Gemmatimonadaceae bacterium]
PDSHLRALFDPAPARDLLRNGQHGPVWVLLVLEEWLRQSQARSSAAQTVSLASESITVATPAAVKRPRILVIADVPNWIFERHARTLQQTLGDEFDITVQYHTDAFEERAWDLIYVMEFGLVPAARITMPWKYVTALRSHVSWSGVPAPELARYLRANFQRTHVVSERLRRELVPWLPTVAYVTHGIDGARFGNVVRIRASGERLRVGWAGNRQTSVKGFAEFIQPLAELDDVELVFCGYSDRNLALDEMPGWYASIDVYVCASLNEGNNNALLEAAASGCAIVTTDNGTVPEFLRHGESAFIVARERDAFVRAVITLRDDPALRERLGAAASAAVLPAWTWDVKVQDYRTFFRSAVAERAHAERRMTQPRPNARLSMATMNDQLQQAVQQGQLDRALDLVGLMLRLEPMNAGLLEVRAVLVGEQARARKTSADAAICAT